MSETSYSDGNESMQPRKTFLVEEGTIPLWEHARQEKINTAMAAHEKNIDANGLRLTSDAKECRKKMANLFASRKGRGKKRQ